MAAFPAFHEVQFPPRIAYGASGGPGFSTSIATSVSGFEQRNINWRTARCRWDISTGIKNSHDIEEILAFFRARFGKAYGFRFKDWTDYKAVGQLIGVGDNQRTEFQLIKDYKSGVHSYVRRILKPVDGSIKVYVDSRDVNSAEIPHPYTVNLEKSTITFQTPPKKDAQITCDFEFDVPARFDLDQIIVRASGPNNFVADSITIVELQT